MPNIRFDLGKPGLDFALRQLGHGRALSKAMTDVAHRCQSSFTLLPAETSADIAKNLDKHLHYQTVAPIIQSSSRLFSDYSGIDALVSVISDLAEDKPNGAIWVEDYLARVNDPNMPKALKNRARVSTLFLEDTVTYLVDLRWFASSLARRLAQSLRSVPIWNGVVLRQVSPRPFGPIVSRSVSDQILAESELVFCTAYDTDGFVFLKP
jgi:hypothetical protein